MSEPPFPLKYPFQLLTHVKTSFHFKVIKKRKETKLIKKQKLRKLNKNWKKKTNEKKLKKTTKLKKLIKNRSERERAVGVGGYTEKKLIKKRMKYTDFP